MFWFTFWQQPLFHKKTSRFCEDSAMLLVEKFIVVRRGWLKIVLQVLANFSGNLIRARKVIQGLNSVKTVLFTFWTAIDLVACVVLALNSSNLDCCVVSSHFKLFCVWFNISTLELQFYIRMPATRSCMDLSVTSQQSKISFSCRKSSRGNCTKKITQEQQKKKLSRAKSRFSLFI